MIGCRAERRLPCGATDLAVSPSAKRSVAAEALRRDHAKRYEESQYDELLDHGAIVVSLARRRAVRSEGARTSSKHSAHRDDRNRAQPRE